MSQSPHFGWIHALISLSSHGKPSLCHPLRLILAILAVSIGVCALTSIISVEDSWRREVMKFFAPLDMNTVEVIFPVGDTWRESGFRRSRQLDLSDVQAIQGNCASAQSVTPMMSGVVWAETRKSAMDVELHAVESDFMKTLPDDWQSRTAHHGSPGRPPCAGMFALT